MSTADFQLVQIQADCTKVAHRVMIGAKYDNVFGDIRPVVGSTKGLNVMCLSVKQSASETYCQTTDLAFVAM